MLVMGQRQCSRGPTGSHLDPQGREGAGRLRRSPRRPKAGPIEARMLDDGTLEGELSTNKGRTKWTGERLQKK